MCDFLIYYRDDLIVLSMVRRVNASGGEIMRYVLQQMHLKTSQFANVSNPILLSELKEICCKSKMSPNVINQLEDYLAIMSKDCYCITITLFVFRFIF